MVESLAARDWALETLPKQSSPWVQSLAEQAASFSAHLSPERGLPSAYTAQVIQLEPIPSGVLQKWVSPNQRFSGSAVMYGTYGQTVLPLLLSKHLWHTDCCMLTAYTSVSLQSQLVHCSVPHHEQLTRAIMGQFGTL